MLDVLQAFFRDKNGGTRKEARRREVGTEQMYLAYRTWVLHVWELEGAPETWRAQLDAYYRQQPVFAVIGGMGSGSWQPVHAFCEGVGLPCVFPDVDYPVDTARAITPLYFSRGVALEAEVLAKHVAETAPSGTDRSCRCFATTTAGACRRRPCAMRCGAGASRPSPTIRSRTAGRCQPSSGTAAAAARPGIAGVWLDAADVLGLGGDGGATRRAAGRLCVGAACPPCSSAGMLPDGWLERLRMVYLFELPAQP